MTSTKEEEEDEYQRLLPTLPKENWMGYPIYFHTNFWNVSTFLKATIAFQNNFKAQDTDLILASMPKSGTTWLKALAFAALNRSQNPVSGSPLLTANPHDLVPFFEIDLYSDNNNPNLDSLPSPRTFATHVPYNSLPSSLRDSKCKIVYICRNPLDHFISFWFFLSKLGSHSDHADQITYEEAFENFCKGISGYGPFWDHVLGYWKASKEMPERILFLKYEDLKKDIVLHLKILAQFLGCPFSTKEEGEGVIEQVAKLCSFEELRDLGVNKTGKNSNGQSNSIFFRNGEVGDWVNYLTPSMADRIKKVTDDNLVGSDLSFEFQ